MNATFLLMLQRQSLEQSAPIATGPIEITTGGVYSGLNIYNASSLVPAVNVLTTEAVHFINCLTDSAGHHYKSGVTGTNITVENCIGTCSDVNMMTAPSMPRGRFIHTQSFNNIQVLNNRLTGTGGIYIHGNLMSGQTAKVLRNEAFNIDGRDYNNDALGPGYYVQFCQISRCIDMVDTQIGWNKVINTYGQSLVEDNINIYASNGTSGDTLLIHDNYIDGAYPLSYLTKTFTGGGIMIDSEYSENVPRYIDAVDNHVLRTTNYGMAIMGGNNNRIIDNRIISLNKTPDQANLFWAGGNNGIQRYNYESAPGGVYFGHTVTGNYVAWANQETGLAQPFYGDGDTISSVDNTAVPFASITRALEEAELALFLNKAATNGITIGPNI
jgi:hypothetical protein